MDLSVKAPSSIGSSHSSVAPARTRKRDTWVKHIIGKVENFCPTHKPAAPPPLVVLDRRPASRSISLECAPIDPTAFVNIGMGKNAHMNFLAIAMKERRMQRKKQAEETMQMLEKVRRENEQERLKQEQARIAEERRKMGGKSRHAAARSFGGEFSMFASQANDNIPLELLPVMHPSHQGFRGLHPHFGRSQVSGFLPDNSSAHSASHHSSSHLKHTSNSHANNRHYYGHVHPKPRSAFDDIDKLMRERNATPLPRGALGSTATGNTHTSQKMMKRRQRYSQILLGDTPAGQALFVPTSRPVPSTSRPITESKSRPVTMQRSRSGRVGIFDPETREQLVPAIQHNDPQDYLTLASDDVLRQRGRSGVYLDHKSLRDRTLSEIREPTDPYAEQGVVYRDAELHSRDLDDSRNEDLDFLTESLFH